MIRLDEKQYRAVKKMTRAACANNDCGNCLLLDDGETCVCVQSISYSLLCRYFREAVLPADRQLCEQITRSGETDLKRCAVCGSTFAAGSNRAKYCPALPIESAGILLVGIVPNPYMTEKGRDETICRTPHTTMTN